MWLGFVKYPLHTNKLKPTTSVVLSIYIIPLHNLQWGGNHLGVFHGKKIQELTVCWGGTSHIPSGTGSILVCTTTCTKPVHLKYHFQVDHGNGRHVVLAGQNWNKRRDRYCSIFFSSDLLCKGGSAGGANVDRVPALGKYFLSLHS